MGKIPFFWKHSEIIYKHFNICIISNYDEKICSFHHNLKGTSDLKKAVSTDYLYISTIHTFASTDQKKSAGLEVLKKNRFFFLISLSAQASNIMVFK